MKFSKCEKQITFLKTRGTVSTDDATKANILRMKGKNLGDKIPTAAALCGTAEVYY